jgi:hypothetical protein
VYRVSELDHTATTVLDSVGEQVDVLLNLAAIRTSCRSCRSCATAASWSPRLRG